MMAQRSDPRGLQPQVTREQAADPEGAHDVLAAEAFAMPAADPQLHPVPVVVPDDPTGETEPHDVLAAEEFPLPAGRATPRGTTALSQRRGGWARIGLEVAVAVVLVRALVRRRG
jgi:hypothetical protein